MEIDFYNCSRGQMNDLFVAGLSDARHCQVFTGNAGYYTQVCTVPRNVGTVREEAIYGYCRDLAVPAYLHEITSPSFPIAVFATIVLYFFIRHIISAASVPRARGVDLSENEWTPPSKRDLRFADIHGTKT